MTDLIIYKNKSVNLCTYSNSSIV